MKWPIFYLSFIFLSAVVFGHTVPFLPFEQKRNRDGDLPFHVATEECAKWMIEENPSLLWEKYLWGDLRIHREAERGNLFFVQWMVKKDPKLLRAKNDNGDFPIEQAEKNVALWMVEEDPSLIEVLAKRYRALAHLSPRLLMEWCAKDVHLLETKDELGMLPIHVAAERSEELTQWMYSINPSLLWAKDEWGRLPIHCIDYSEVSTDLLLWMVDQDPNLLLAPSSDGSLPFHDAGFELINTVHFEASMSFYLPLLIEKCPALLQARGKKGQTVLHLAAEGKHVALAKWLVSKERSLLTTPDYSGRFPVHMTSSEELIRFFIEENKELLTKTDDQGVLLLYPRSPEMFDWMIEVEPKALFLIDFGCLVAYNPQLALKRAAKDTELFDAWKIECARRWEFKLFQELMRIEPFSAYDDISKDALIRCLARYNEWEKLKWLAQQDPSFLFQKDTSIYFPICDVEDFSLFKWMIEKEPRLISMEVGDPFRILLAAIDKGNKNQAQYLLDRCPQLIDQVDQNGYSLLHLATEQWRGGEELAKLFVSKKRELLRAKTPEGITPFHLAVKYCSDLAYWMLQEDPDLLMIPDVQGNYPIHYAPYSNTDLMKWLFRFRPSQLFLRDADMNLPISLAIDARNWELIDWMIQQEPSFMNETGKDWDTIYHVAASYGEPLIFPAASEKHHPIKKETFPLINPGIIQDLSGKEDLIVAISLEESQQSNRYFYGGYPYEWVGKTDNGIAVLKTETGLLLITLIKDQRIQFDWEKHAMRWGESRTLVKKIGEIPLEPSFKEAITLSGNHLKIGEVWDIDLEGCSFQERKTASPLTFWQVPLVSPKIVHELTSWISDREDQVAMIHLTEAQDHPKFRLSEDHGESVYADLSDPNAVYGGWDRPEFFRYSYLGEDQASGVHFLETSECTGGMATFISVIAVQLIEDEGLSFDWATQTVHKKRRLLLKKVGGTLLSDRPTIDLTFQDGALHLESLKDDDLNDHLTAYLDISQ